MDVSQLSVSAIREGLKEKSFSASDIARASLERIRTEDARVHAFVNVTEEDALKGAEEVDKLIAEGKELPALAGVPCGVKDAILQEGAPCTAGSLMLEDYIAPMDATAVARLREAGALLVGKTNLDEFSMGASTEYSAFGPTRNPHDPERVPGGTSGGSAAAVADGACVLALGADTGGSVRQPASFCGVVGLKPTYGTVSRYGLIAQASSLDQIGPLARSVEDAEAAFRAIRGKDELDATSVDYPSDAEKAVKGLRVGVPKEYFSEGLDEQVEEKVRGAVAELEKEGAEVREIELPHTPYGIAAYYIINTSEASSNLARYEGIRYGRVAGGEPAPLLDFYTKNRGEGFGPEVKRRIMLGTYALSAGYYDAYYLKAQKVRALLKRDFDRAFEEVDVICGPVSPQPPFTFGEKTEDPLAMYLVDAYTVPVSMAGLPGLSLPVGFSREGLPVGMQLVAPAFQESVLFQVGKTYENLHG